MDIDERLFHCLYIIKPKAPRNAYEIEQGMLTCVWQVKRRGLSVIPRRMYSAMSSQRDNISWSPMTHSLVEFYILVLARTPSPPPIRTLNTVYHHRLQKLALKGDESERKIASGRLAKWRVCVGVFGWVFATTINTCVCVLRRPSQHRRQAGNACNHAHPARGEVPRHGRVLSNTAYEPGGGNREM